jgi:hypothetical protein
MVFAKEKLLYQLYFPKSVAPPTDAVDFVVDFFQTIDGNHFTWQVVDEKNYSDFYVFNIDFGEYEDMEIDREYNYTILTNNEVLERGLFRLGEYTAPKTEHKEEITYKQYDF